MTEKSPSDFAHLRACAAFQVGSAAHILASMKAARGHGPAPVPRRPDLGGRDAPKPGTAAHMIAAYNQAIGAK